MKESSEDVETAFQGETSEGFASEAHHGIRRARRFEKAVPGKGKLLTDGGLRDYPLGFTP